MKSDGQLNQERTLLLAACVEPSTDDCLPGTLLEIAALAMSHERIAEQISLAGPGLGQRCLRNSVGEAGAMGIVSQREAEPVCCGAVGGLRVQNRVDLCVCKANSLGASLS
jgi:hypothetical protein